MRVRTLPYLSDDFNHPSKLLHSASVLTGRKDVASAELDGWGGSHTNMKITFEDGSPYAALVKQSAEGGMLREAASLELARFLGMPAYEIVAAEDFVIVQLLKSRAVDFGKPAQWAKSVGYLMPFVHFVGYSDNQFEHIIQRPDGEAALIDWGSGLVYQETQYVQTSLCNWHLRGLMPKHASDFAAGEAAAKKRILDRYTAPGAREEIEELLAPLNKEAYTRESGNDSWLLELPSVPHRRTGKSLVEHARSEMDRLAAKWTAEGFQ